MYLFNLCLAVPNICNTNKLFVHFKPIIAYGGIAMAKECCLQIYGQWYSLELLSQHVAMYLVYG